jgi:hypothetical protein
MSMTRVAGVLQHLSLDTSLTPGPSLEVEGEVMLNIFSGRPKITMFGNKIALLTEFGEPINMVIGHDDSVVA